MITKIEGKELENSIPIENNRAILKLLCDLISDSYKNNKISLTEDFTDKLIEIFGENNTTFRGEFFNKIWFLEFEGEKYNIFYSKKGTSIEIQNSSESEIHKKTSKIEKFLLELYKIINK